MEAPTVKEEIKVEHSYKIISDKNNSFNLIFQNLNSSIQIIASYEDNVLTHYYEKNIIFDELKKNKLLALCDSIDEIYDEIIHNLNKNQTKIIEETNQIIINIPTDHIKIKEILFIVYEKIKNDKETINELLSIISNLKEEINDLKTNKIENINEKINNLEKENKEFKKDNSTLNEKINNLEKENEILKQYLPYLEEYKKKQDEIKIKIKNLDSLIIENNIKYNKTLKNWIDPNIKIKSELLYRMSRDGIEYSKFHNLCDNKGATITLIKLEDGNILGNYTPLSWDSTNIWKNDLNMFIFNLTENIKCIKNNQDSYGIYCRSDYGPYAGVIEFKSSNKMNNPYINPNSSYYNECNKIYSKSRGHYKSVEVEVFKIILD